MSGLAVRQQVLKRYLGPGEIPDRSIVLWRDAYRVRLLDHLTDHRPGYAKVPSQSTGPSGGIAFQPVFQSHARSLDSSGLGCQAFSRPGPFSIGSTVKEHRRARFQELLDSRFRGDRKALMRATGLTKGRVSQLLDPNEPFGDNAAQRLVEKLSLPENYFDVPPAVDVPLPLSGDALQVALAYEKMTPAEKMRLDRLMAAAMDVPLVQQDVPRNLGGMSHLGELDEQSDAKKKKGA